MLKGINSRLPRLTQEEVENMNRSTINNEIELVTKNSQQTNSSWPAGFTDECYQTFRDSTYAS